MSSRSLAVPKRLSDAHFIGDLMNLFERRKIPLGDAASFQTFESELASNDLLRSGLFTLCTAISHMGEEDLSGEELLALVARALTGPAAAKRGAIEIPDGMRSAFLKGYDAWSNRDVDMKEPLPWPALKPEGREESATTALQAEETVEPIAAKPRAPGIHTVQEALEIAKKRFPAAAVPVRQPQPGASDANGGMIEGLTLSELKALLEDIEHRVTRIQPQVRELNTNPRPAADFGRRETMHEIDEALSASEPPNTPHRSPSSSKLNEAAFLARHAYLSPTRRVTPHAPTSGVNTRPAVAAPAPFAAASPTPFVAPLAAATPAPYVATPAPEAFATVLALPAAAIPAPFVPVAQVDLQPAVATPTAVPVQPTALAVPVPFEPAIVPIAVPELPKHFAEAFHPLEELRAAMAAPQPNPDAPTGSIYFRVGKFRIGPRTMIGSLIAFIILAGGLGGILIYPSLHPYYFYSNSGLQPATSASAGASQNPAAAANPESAAQVILTAPDPQSVVAQPVAGPRIASSASSKGRAKSGSQEPPISVWPAVGNSAAVAMPPAPVSASPVTRWNGSPSRPVYVPSTTIIGYAVSAPQPIYPRDQPKGIVGTVVLQVTISREGEVTDIRTLSGPVEMRPATVQAVQAWRFRPYLVNGNPVEVTTSLGFLFRGQ